MTSRSEFFVTLCCMALLAAGCSSPSGPAEPAPAGAPAPTAASAATLPPAPATGPAAAPAAEPAAAATAAPVAETTAPQPEVPAPRAAAPTQAAPPAPPAAPVQAAPALPTSAVTPIPAVAAVPAVAAAPGKSVVDPGGHIAVPAPRPGLKSTGADACGECHDVQYESWAKDAHAARKPPLDCEGCHGPGSEYKANSVMKNPDKARAAGLVMPDKAFCTLCHKTGVNDAFLKKAHAHEE